MLEELANRHAGALRVAKVDTDAEPAVAAQYGVRSLPTLLLFRDGEALTQWVGAQPLAALEAALEPYLPRATDPLLEEAGRHVAAGEYALARQPLEAALAMDETDYRVHPLLAECLVEAGELEQARRLLQALPANVAVDEGPQRALARLELASAAAAAGGGDATASAYHAALEAASKGEHEQAVEALIDLLAQHRDWQDGAIRRALVDLFKVLEGDPRVKGWRTRMARTLN